MWHGALRGHLHAIASHGGKGHLLLEHLFLKLIGLWRHLLLHGLLVHDLHERHHLLHDGRVLHGLENRHGSAWIGDRVAGQFMLWFMTRELIVSEYYSI